MPWQGYENGQYVQSMQLVDYSGDQLVKRGLIAHRLNARRAASLSNRVLSLSGQELLVVDATDRDKPVVKADLDLSFVVTQVRVSGDRLVLLSTTGGSIPTVRRVAAASPDAVLGSLALPPYPVVGFEMAETNLHLLQLEPDTYRQEPVLGTNQVVTWIDQPPIRKEIVRTNIDWEFPEPIVTNRIITRIVVFPLLPTDPPGTQPRTETNIHILPVIIQLPPVLVTNVQTIVRFEPVPPLPSTNLVVVTNSNSVTIPGALVAREIGFDGDAPRELGQSRIQRPAAYSGSIFRGLRAAPELLLWTEPSSNGNGWGWGWPTDVLIPGGFGGIAVGDGFFPGRRGWWWSWWQNTLVVVAEDISVAGSPVLRSAVTLGGTGKHQGFSDAYVSEGRLYVSHREAITREETKGSDATGGIFGPGFPTPWWVTETRHLLNVVDFADPAEPMFRTPIGIPAELAGISHRAGLIYTSGTTTNTPAGRTDLSALAYDGLGAALVDATTVSTHSEVQVKPDGNVYAVEPASANGVSAQVHTLWITSEGRWNRGTSVNVPGSSPVLRSVGSLLTTDAPEGLGFVRPADGGAVLLGVMPGTCGQWIDWTAGDAGADATVWAPGIGARLLKLQPEAGRTGP